MYRAAAWFWVQRYSNAVFLGLTHIVQPAMHMLRKLFVRMREQCVRVNQGLCIARVHRAQAVLGESFLDVLIGQNPAATPGLSRYPFPFLR